MSAVLLDIFVFIASHIAIVTMDTPIACVLHVLRANNRLLYLSWLVQVCLKSLTTLLSGAECPHGVSVNWFHSRMFKPQRLLSLIIFMWALLRRALTLEKNSFGITTPSRLKIAPKTAHETSLQYLGGSLSVGDFITCKRWRLISANTTSTPLRKQNWTLKRQIVSQFKGNKLKRLTPWVNTNKRRICHWATNQ